MQEQRLLARRACVSEFEGNGNEAPPPPPPHPNAIATLYATGVDNNRIALVGGAVPDPHWTII